jgi:antitoxin component of MazEF toxin-antitoxin module
MIKIKTKLQKWGNSFGVVVPVNSVKQEGIKEGDEVSVFVMREKKKNVLEETFGTLNVKKSADEIMKEIDESLDVEF